MKHAFLKVVLFLATHLLAYLSKYVCRDETIKNGLASLIAQNCSQCKNNTAKEVAHERAKQI